MARRKKRLVETNEPKTDNTKEVEILRYIKLVETVRKTKNEEESNNAFNEIARLIEPKIQQIVSKFTIPGHSRDDIYQEALFALRFKAIKDYDKSRSDLKELSPFDKFAALCIRRHLSTKLKASYQNKSKLLNTSISLDQDRNRNGKNSDESLFLSDILDSKSEDIPQSINDRQRRKILFKSLYEKLSNFEKEVLVLYCKKYSYDDMARFIRKSKKKTSNSVTVKSIDNALSRIKLKAKSVYKLYGDCD